MNGTGANPKLELSRPIKAKSLPGEAIVIEADAAERAALAARFGLPGVDSLHAQINVEPRGNAIRAVGSLKAAIRQTCAVSGEDFPAKIEEELDLRFVEEGALSARKSEDDGIDIELVADDCDEIEFSGGFFDLGEAIAQSLGLAIDPYAEGPSADETRKRAGIVGEGEQEGPLAEMLKGLTRD